MASFSSLSCPRCQAVLRSTKALPVGGEIPCSGCSAPLRIEVADQQLVVRLVEKAAAPVQTPLPGRLERPARAVQVAAPFAPPPARGGGKLVAGIMAAILFSAGGTAVAYFFLQERPASTPLARVNFPERDSLPVAAATAAIPTEPASQPTVLAAKDKRAAQQNDPPPAEPRETSPPKQRTPAANDNVPPPRLVAAEKPAQPGAEKPQPAPPLVQPAPPDPELAARVQRLLEQQKKIDAAIARGVQYLRSDALPKGNHPIGRAALRGLTLLECGVPAQDPVVQQLTLVVRSGARDLRETYDTSLAILFLDRLGDPRDTQSIQVLALRLVAGQTLAGGWNYPCPPLEVPEMQQLITFLQMTRPKLKTSTPLVHNDPPPFLVPLKERTTLQTPLPNGTPLTTPLDKKGETSLLTPLPGETLLDLQTFLPGFDLRNLSTPLEKIEGGDMPEEQEKSASTPTVASEKPGTTAPPSESKTDTIDPKPVPAEEKRAENKPDVPTAPKIRPKSRLEAPKNGGQVIPPQVLAERLRRLPVVLTQNVDRGKIVLPNSGRDDNSNSQFALLALWTARRHGVATERVLFVAEQRYRQWQNQDGGWGYQRGPGSTAAMTGVGLLGLAMGHGADFDLAARDLGMAPAYTDPAIERGLARFATFIGNPDDRSAGQMQNLYFLWSVERVAMLYRLRSIGGKDWYGWGAQSLLTHQYLDGSWVSAPYPGSHDKSVDTCFALLFLRRSNLVADLAANITQRIAVDARPEGEKK